jgi:predicted nucleic acid-binding protein
MRALLDTNIVIHREAGKVVRQDIGILFNWLDKLNYEKCVHPLSLDELRKHKDASVVQTMEIKLKSYHVLKTQAPEGTEISDIRAKFDKTANDAIDTSLLNEVFSGRLELLISEDRKIHEKAKALGIEEKVFTIDAFLEKVVAENPGLTEYKVLSVKKEYFGAINIADPFFDSFKQDYKGFEAWFAKKSDEIAYTCRAEDNSILAFLYVKQEKPGEDYSAIEPRFEAKNRLKVGTFKVVANGYKLGERFVKIIFDNAINCRADEIYVTIFDEQEEKKRLVQLLQEWGFRKHGLKYSASGKEGVYVRDLTPVVNKQQPSLTYPFVSSQSKKFIVPIYPEYHTELLPDSILRTESPMSFIENRPNRNAISKVYISRSIERRLSPGDIVVFYRTKSNNPAYYTSVTTTIGIVQNVITNIPNLEQFIALCRKRSVFSNEELAEYWNRKPSSRPFIVNFLYVYTLPKKLTLKELQEHKIIEEAPRGFERLSDDAFKTLMEKSNATQRFIVN